MSKKKINQITIRSSAAEYLTYVASVGGEESSVEMRYEDENIWLTQKRMAVLYGVSVSAVNQHLKRIHHNLQAIIAVGFKVNNERAVQFRKWAGQIVKDYTIQGWTGDRYENTIFNRRNNGGWQDNHKPAVKKRFG